MKCNKYVNTESTRDYSIFTTPDCQREVNESNIKGVMESIREFGVIGAISVRPSIDNPSKYDIFDGQHVLIACKRLKVPVIYNVFTNVPNKAMIAINGKSRKWKMQDYLHYGVKDKLDDYEFIGRIYKSERLPLTALVMMYGGTYQNKQFKDLEWRALTVSRGDEILGYIKDFENSHNIQHARYARFIWGLGQIVDTQLYNHKRMMKQLSKCSQWMTKQANPEGYAKNIQMIYNHGVRDKDRVQFIQ